MDFSHGDGLGHGGLSGSGGFDCGRGGNEGGSSGGGRFGVGRLGYCAGGLLDEVLGFFVGAFLESLGNDNGRRCGLLDNDWSGMGDGRRS
jgi:hypothetical protein